MRIDKKKYRSLIYLLYPLYVNFIFLTPFLHYHSSDENSIDPNKMDIHSHLINGHHEDHSHEGEQNLDNCDDHEHLFKINTYQFTKLTKQIELLYACDIISFNDDISQNLKEYKIPIINIDLPSKTRWEKYVHTATNTSPPIA